MIASYGCIPGCPATWALPNLTWQAPSIAASRTSPDPIGTVNFCGVIVGLIILACCLSATKWSSSPAPLIMLMPCWCVISVEGTPLIWRMMSPSVRPEMPAGLSLLTFLIERGILKSLPPWSRNPQGTARSFLFIEMTQGIFKIVFPSCLLSSSPS